MYFETNDIHNKKKVACLLSVIGPKNLRTVKGFVCSSKVSIRQNYITIVDKLALGFIHDFYKKGNVA